MTPKKPQRKSARSTRRGEAARDTVAVELGERSYDIEIGEDWLETIGRRVADRLDVERVALLTVPTVARRYAPALTRGLRAAGVRVRKVVVPDGDATKNLRRARRTL